MFIAEVLLSIRAMHEAMEILRPFLAESEAVGLARVIIETGEGDPHDVGKNLIAMMLKGAAFTTVELGGIGDLKPEAFVEAAKVHRADILGMSALLTATLQKMEQTINTLEEAGIHDRIKVMAGGAPETLDYADEIRADAYGSIKQGRK